MRVTCVIPAYNEAPTVAEVVRSARACALVDEVIVVSDGSVDATPDVAALAGADRVITLPRNGGKAHAVFAAAAAARGDVLLLLDGDLIGLQPAHLETLLLPVLEGRAVMAVAVFAGDPWPRLMRSLSGQRAVRRELLLDRPDVQRTGFGLEIALDRLAREQASAVERVVWRGVRHRSKGEKYGTVQGLRLKLRASSDLVRQAGRPRRPWRRPATRRSRRLPARRSPPMVVALFLLVVVFTLSAPVFLVHPSHASAHVLHPVAALPPEARLLVVVAHPDDEVVGAGGFIAAARARGIAVGVVVVTNGDSNRLSAAVLARKVRPRAEQMLEEGRIRQRETVAALSRLGVPAAQVFFLGFPDRGLDQVLRSRVPFVSPFTGLGAALYPDVVAPRAPYTRQALTAALRQVVEDVRPTLVVTHAPFDRHADHRVVAALVAEVAGDLPTYAFLVHAPAFPRPLRMALRDPLMPPASLRLDPGWTWLRFDLTPEVEAAKRQAVGAYRSQLATPYLRLLLPSFVRTNELFAVRRP